MTRALLGADYRDIGRSHTVEVLEELRDGFLRKANHAENQAFEADFAENYEESENAQRDFNCWKAAADDVTCFIQREQIVRS